MNIQIIKNIKGIVILGIFVLTFFAISSRAFAADRYWIGGAGSWSDTAHWSDASGGTGGFSVPTSSDNVYFTSSSGTGTVAINAEASMADLSFSSINAITLSNSAYNFNVYGNLTLPSSNLTVSFSSTGYLYLRATTSVNITSNGNTSSWNKIYMNGVGGTWTNQDNWNTASSYLYLANGTWDTNSKTITLGVFYTDVGTKTLTLGSSTFNCGGFQNLQNTNFTFNAGTSLIYQYGSWQFNSGNLTFYNLKISHPANTGITVSGNFTVSNDMTFLNASGGVGALSPNGNLTVNGTLYLTGYSRQYPLLVASSAIGSQRTFTAANVVASNVDLRDIKGAGAANWDLSAITGLSGDAGGNSGITFTTAQPQYFKHTSGAVNWSDSSKWFSDSSPRTTPGRVPLPQDDVYFDANSFTGTSTLTVDVPRIGKNIDMSAITQNITMTKSNQVSLYGNLILSDKITHSGNYYIELHGRNSQDFLINTYNKTLYGLYLYSVNGKYTLQSNVVVSIGFLLASSTVDLNDYNVTCRNFSGTNNYASVFYLGSGTITISASNGGAFGVFNTDTVYAEGSTIKYINKDTGTTDVNFTGAGKVYNNIWFSGDNPNYFVINGSNTFNQFKIDAGRKVKFIAGTIQNIASFVAVGTSDNQINLTSATSATHTLNYTGAGAVVGDYLNISYSTATPANKWYASNSTNSGNNSGWIFANAPDAPTGLTPTAGDTQVSLSWTAPADNGTAITDYVVEYKLTTDSTWSIFADAISTLTTATIIGLTNSRSYDFRVSAVNNVGQGVASATTSSIPFSPNDRYWIGGTGNWSDTTHWANYDGGPGGQSTPTSTNNVYFSASSISTNGAIITLDTTANTANLDFSGLTKTMTLTSSANVLNIYGSLVDSTNLYTSFSGTAYLYFKATSSQTITSNGAVHSWNRIYFDGVGGTWTNQDNWNVTGSNIYLFNGTYDTNSKNITSNLISSAGSTATRNFYARNSTITTGWQLGLSTTNLSFYCGQSTIINTYLEFYGGGFTYYNVQLIYALKASIWSSNTFYSLTRNGSNSVDSGLFLTANQTITGNLNLNGNNSTSYRLLLASNTIGTQYTITVDPAKVTASNVDFRDIRFANAIDLSGISGGSGDAGGNSGITFTTAQPQWFKHTSGAVNWSDSTKWFSDQAKTIPGRVPLPQDDATFDAGSFTGTSTLTVNVPRIGRSLDMSEVNQSVTMILANDIESYGSYILNNNLITSGNKTIFYYGIGDYYINSYNKSLYSIKINSVGTYTFLSDFTCSSYMNLARGTKDFNDFNITCPSISSVDTNAQTLYAGNGIITVTDGFSYGGTFYPENSTIILNPNSGSSNVYFGHGSIGRSFNKVRFSGNHNGNFDIRSNNTFNELIIDPGRKVRFTAGTTQQIGKLTANGTVSNPITISSITGATHTLNYTEETNAVGDYLNISYSNATPANKWYASNSTNGGNNSGWIFANVPDAPTDIIGTSGNSQVSLSWQVPADSGGLAITDYIIEYKISTDSVWTTFSDGISTNTTAVVTGLINGTSYDFQVSAVNPVGQSNASTTTTATPMTVPGAPTINSVTPLDGQVSVDFSAPASDGGSPITSYTVTSNPGGIIGTGVSSPIVVSGLSNGTPYTFTVTATNAIGEGPSSSPSASVTPRTVPNAPTALSATFGNSQVSLSWMAPSFDGGSPITDYAVEYKISSDSVWSTFADGVSIDLSAIVTGLSNGTPYDFRVSAINIAGQSDPSDTANATPATVPDAPTITSVVPANGQVTVYFDPPSSNGGSTITSYTATSNPGNIIEVGATSPITVTGLTNGTPYTFTVTATNIAGTSAPSVESDEVVPATIPDTPTALFASPGNAVVDLSWTAPLYNGGSPIIDYAVEYKISSDSVWATFADGVSDTTLATVTGLSNGTSYDFRVSAVNVMGQSSPSTETSATPVTVPDAPTNISATAGNAEATISFDPPAFDGGSTINSYTVTSNPGGITATGNSSPITITGLTNGTTYTFTVTATNAIGEGPSSSPSNAVTPVTVPDAPTSVVAVEGNSEATVSFTPPAFDGGTPITSYTATSNPGNFTGTSNGSPIVVGGLTNGMTYTFTVVATNNVGDSLPSAPSNSVTLSTEPSEPVNLASTVLGSSIGLTWSPPLSNGGSAITDYVIEYKLTSGGVWSIFADGLNVNTTAIVTGLSNGTSYDFRVKAVNIIGEGPASSTVTATPGEPAQVIIQSFSDLTVSDIGANVRITNEGSEDYEYQYTWCITDSDSNLCGGGDDLFSATAAKQIDAGENWDTNLVSTILVPGNYFFHINVIYGSESSNAYQSFTALATYPNAPTNISATAGNAEATISFDPPAFDGGSPINSYTVTSNPGGLTATGNTSPITITGLSNGTTYTFTVTATNAIGEGPSSSPSNAVTPVTVPDAPTSVVAVPGDKKVSLSWTAPINDGGSPVIDYIVEYKLSSESNWIVFADGVSTNTFAIVTGLTNNFSYDFRISAVNAYGQSAVIESNIFLPNQGGSSTGSSSGSIVVRNPIIPEVIPETIIDQGETTKPTTKIEKGKTNNNITNSNLPIPENIKLPKNEARSTPVERPKKSIFPSEEVASSGNAKIYRYIIIISSGVIFIWFVLFIIKRLRRRNTNN